MKKIFALVTLFLLFSVIVALAGDRVQYSATSTGNALIVSGTADFHGITITGDGTNAVTVDIYNGLTSAGAKIAPSLAFVQSQTNKTQTYGVNPPVNCNTGIYIAVATAGTVSYTVYYNRY